MLRLAPAIWDETIAALRECGEGRRECVVYWLGPLADPTRVDKVVHPKHTAEPWHYRIDDRWLTALFVQLAHEQLSIRAQLHTHGGAASHSKTDDDWPVVQLAGLLSIVLGSFAMPPLDPARVYVVELQQDGHWGRRHLRDVVDRVS